MRTTKKSGARAATKKSGEAKSGSNGKKMLSFRDLKAFGMWADRPEMLDPIFYVTQLRKRMEHGRDAPQRDFG